VRFAGVGRKTDGNGALKRKDSILDQGAKVRGSNENNRIWAGRLEREEQSEKRFYQRGFTKA